MAKQPAPAAAPATETSSGPTIEERLAALEANSHPPVDLGPAIEAGVKAYLDANLEELVKAALPPTPEQQAKAERESLEKRIAKDRAANERRVKREQREAERRAQQAAADQAERDAAAAKAFNDAVPFVGSIADLSDKIVRHILIDNGAAYSADHRIPVRFAELLPQSDGGLLLNKPIDLPGRGREFIVRGVSLVTDAGTLRIALNGTRKCGGGSAVQFPAKSLVFRPARAAAIEAQG